MSLSEEDDHMLSPRAVARYHAQGLIVPDARIDAETIERIIGLADDLFGADPGLSRDFAASQIERDPRWLEIAGLPVILDCLSDLIGGHFLCWGSSIFGKPARTGKETPWHQDGRYWPIKPLAACTVWIALDRSLPENGCLRIVPGSHRRGSHARCGRDLCGRNDFTRGEAAAAGAAPQ